MPSEEQIVDELTGFLHPGGLTVRFAELSQQARRTHRPVCLLLCELDNFNMVDDWSGVEAGDAVLRALALEMRRRLRAFELVYRTGRELFLIVLPGVDVDAGAKVAERLRAAAERLCPEGFPITISVGVTAGRGHHVRRFTLSRAAEGALFAARRAGGNRVCATPRDGIGPQLAEVPGDLTRLLRSL